MRRYCEKNNVHVAFVFFFFGFPVTPFVVGRVFVISSIAGLVCGSVDVPASTTILLFFFLIKTPHNLASV